MADFNNLWGYVLNIKEMQQPFNANIESILLKICIHYLFCTPTTVLDILEPSATAGLGILEPLASVKQIQVGIGINRGYIKQKCKIQTVDNSKRTLEYIGNTEPGNLWYNYVIVKNQKIIIPAVINT